MRGFRHWLGSATLLLTPTVTFAQGFGPTPGPLPFPPALSNPTNEATQFGGGTVVSKPTGSVSVLPVAQVQPIPMTMPAGPKMAAPTNIPGPTTTVTSMPTGTIPGLPTQQLPATTIPGIETTTMPTSSTSVLTEGWQMMLGSNGPVGEELYFRTGPSLVFGSSVLGKNLETGWNATVGGRSLFFNPEGSAAWVIDAHLGYTYNNATGSEVAFFRNEAVTVRSATRWVVGLGAGRDWFSNNPGFVMGQWDMNFSWGVDAGARWGTGHVALNPLSEINGYRRHHDVFGQSFVSLHGGIELPMGGWTMLLGGRAEWNYTFSDLLPANGSIHGVDLLVNFGVRY